MCAYANGIPPMFCAGWASNRSVPVPAALFPMEGIKMVIGVQGFCKI